MLFFLKLLAFFPFFNFGLTTEIFPFGALALLFYVRASFLMWLLLILSCFFVIAQALLIENVTLFLPSIVILIFILLLSSNLKLDLKVIKLAHLIWFFSILLSNFSTIFQWSLLEQFLFRRVYSCDLPFACARGGSGFAPEPAYAAYAVFFISLVFSVRWATSRSDLGFVALGIISLILLKVLIAYIFVIIIVFVLLFKNLNAKNVLTSVIVFCLFSILGQFALKNNERATDLMSRIEVLSDISDLAAIPAVFGSTRELGTYCGYAVSGAMPMLSADLIQDFKECQNQLMTRFTGRVLESIGVKPYSPFAYISLYHGLVLSIAVLFMFVYARRVDVAILSIIILVSVTRIPVTMPFGVLMLMHYERRVFNGKRVNTSS